MLDVPPLQHGRRQLLECLFAPLPQIFAPSGRNGVGGLPRLHRDRRAHCQSLASRHPASGVALSRFFLHTLLSLRRLCMYGDAAMLDLSLGPHRMIWNSLQLVSSSIASLSTVCLAPVFCCCSPFLVGVLIVALPVIAHIAWAVCSLEQAALHTSASQVISGRRSPFGSHPRFLPRRLQGTLRSGRTNSARLGPAAPGCMHSRKGSQRGPEAGTTSRAHFVNSDNSTSIGFYIAFVHGFCGGPHRSCPVSHPR